MHEIADLQNPILGSPSKTLVVISHYDKRPIKNLFRLLKSMVDHDAEITFDVCVVVNQESGRPVDLPSLPFRATVLYRQNVGMNIGSWNHGWRENVGYEHYIFLQDECIIRRTGWLKGLVQCLKTPGTGMVGECVNYRWSKPWNELIDEDIDNSSDPGARKFADRARFCLDFIRSRNIPAGDSARHLRSLVWGFSSDTLKALKEFPLGSNYDECVAAEIAVSRQVENMGLTITQAHRFPFYYVVHSQWVNTYPGFSASLSYEDWTRKQFTLPSFPFLSFVGKGDSASRLEQLVKRAATERGLFDGGVIPVPRDGFIALLTIFIERSPLDRELAITTLTWCLQSSPHIDVLLVAKDKFLLDKTRDWMSRRENDQFSKVNLILLSEWSSLDLSQYQFLVFARPGDQFHPSTAASLVLLDNSEQPDIIVWNELRSKRAEPGGWLQYQPKLEPLTICASAHIGLAFAVRPSRIREFPYDFVDDLVNNDCHLFHIWLSQCAATNWSTHPEFLTSRMAVESDISTVERSKKSYDAYRTNYRRIIESSGNYEVFPDQNGHRGSPLVPVRRAQSISAVVSFRDRSQETITCLKSLVNQKTTGHLEVILINNLSSERPLSLVQDAAELLRQQGADIKIFDYESPFNHSRQTNLGVKLSSGEVLFFFNNDAELLESGVLEELAAWALVPNIGTVGCQMLGDRDQLECAGIRLRPNDSGLHTSPVEESKETSFRSRVREVFANTFACAAIARTTFEKVGSLNETEFPNGYNDIEYCLRTKRQKFVNLYVGHRQVRHTPGTSRGRCDESFQKVLLRTRYPELSTDRLFQLSCEWRSEEMIRSNGSASVEATNWSGAAEMPPVGMEAPPVGMKDALKVLNKAMIWWVQRRILS
jgi:GT2 family glycosyltransferase